MQNQLITSQLSEINTLAITLVEQLSGKTLYGYQKRIISRINKAIFCNEGIVFPISVSRQAGKTEAVTGSAVFLSLCYYRLCKEYSIQRNDGFSIGFFGPKEDQPRTDFNRVKEYLIKAQQKGLPVVFNTFNGQIINISIKGMPKVEILCMSASPTAHIESKTLNLIFIEEAQDVVDAKVKNAIIPMGTSTNATICLIGPAGYKRCLFKKYLDEAEEQNKIVMPYKEVIKERREVYERTNNLAHLNYETFINAEMRRIGTEDDAFKTQYLLQWMLERGQFITYDELINLESSHITAERNKVYDNTVYCGIDWGKAQDSTVLTVINENYEIVALYEWQGDDYDSQINEISNILNNEFRKVIKVYCDSTGNQDMAVDVLRKKLKNIPVLGITFTSQSKDVMFKNLSRLMKNMYSGAELVEKAKLKIPAVYDSVKKNRFLKQMIDLQKEIKNGLWACGHPSGDQYHDDYCCSLALAVYEFRPQVEGMRKISFHIA